MVASWTRFATDECPRCLSTDIEKHSTGRRCQRCGASVESDATQVKRVELQGSAAQAEEKHFALNPKVALLLIFLLLMLVHFAAGRANPSAGIENASCNGNCIAGNMAAL